MVRLLAHAAVLGLASFIAGTAAQSTGTYSLGGNAVSTESRSIPPRGCKCLDTRQSWVATAHEVQTPNRHSRFVFRPCQKYDCTCTCDLTAQACDVNCCCDSEVSSLDISLCSLLAWFLQCSSSEVDGFRNAGTCADESAGQVDYLRCSDLTADESLALVNPKYRMELQQHSTLDAVTCIAVDNNPVEGDF